MVLVVRKYNILMICLLLTVSYISYCVTMQDTAPTVVLPVTNKVIVLDAGHGGPDPGAIGKSGALEKDINLDIVLKLQGYLEQGGCIVQLTRAVDESIHDKDKKSIRNKKRSDLKNRKDIINSSQADAYVSIHLNSFPQSRYKGVQSFYPRNSEDSKRLAVSVQKELKETLQIDDNREALPIGEVYLMQGTQVPSVIVECGFLSNPEEERNLSDDKYRERVAWGIYMGIMRFFEII
ncbi:N-acetylmuramoyl-L-alanine amidase CwlD [Lutispora sp.]|uniref:N-acetylmuramoyl-L-alanine amidase CwlD n=1 Tax=Lutispora sp. TaxID=2828727 RepID=UPI003569C454